MLFYAWGSNGSGQLGIGHQDDVSIPTLVTVLDEHDRDIPQAIAAGGNHTLILYDSGRLAVIGESTGLPKINDARRITCCSANWETSTICIDSQAIVTLGTGGHGELGRGPTITQYLDILSAIDLSLLVDSDVSITHSSSGLQHTVAVLSNGSVLGWGNGRKGQLGEPSEIVWTPRLLTDINFKVVKAVCGQYFTFLAGHPESGHFLVLGQDKFGVRSQAPTTIMGWKDIGASWGSIFVLLDTGRLISWGRDDHSQLAPEGLPNISKIAVGSEHALALSDDSKLYAWGWGEHGNCGPNIDENGDAEEPREIVLPLGAKQIQGIAAGCATSWLWI